MTSSNGNIFRVTDPWCGIYWSPVNSPPKGQRRGALMFSLICAWMNGLVNSETGDLRRHHAHYDITWRKENVVVWNCFSWLLYTLTGTGHEKNQNTCLVEQLIYNSSGVYRHIIWHVYKQRDVPMTCKLTVMQHSFLCAESPALKYFYHHFWLSCWHWRIIVACWRLLK